MKIKSIAAICKKNKNIAIFERYSDDGDILTQYIGDGSAVYPVIGLPPLDAESLLTIFDVPEKDRVAKAGFLLQAVIMPYDVINQQFVESLQALTRECEFALSEKERREREARDHFAATEPEQFALNVDPNTGEIVEGSEVADNA